MDYLNKAKGIENEIQNDYLELHKRAEVGFELTETVAYVKNRLSELNIEYFECGKNGILGYIGDKNASECILLRADMDALPIKEEAKVGYKSESGAMHACGHDGHTAMLLGTAKILKQQESELTGCVKLLFQPAEELLEGANNMIENGALEAPTVKAAVMLHIIVGTELESGCAIISSGGVSAPSADYFRITVNGSGCHGSTPEKGRDPLAAVCRIVSALDVIKAKELAVSEKAVITVGKLCSGVAPNVIPDTATAEGSIRAYNEDTREYIRQRIKNIVKAFSGAFETQGDVDFYVGTPSLMNDSELSEKITEWANELLPKGYVKTSEELQREAKKNGKQSEGAGSEDFAYISRKVPSVMIGLASGKCSNGYIYPLHHPEMRLDTASLPYGSALLSKIASEWIKCRK